MRVRSPQKVAPGGIRRGNVRDKTPASLQKSFVFYTQQRGPDTFAIGLFAIPHRVTFQNTTA